MSIEFRSVLSMIFHLAAFSELIVPLLGKFGMSTVLKGFDGARRQKASREGNMRICGTAPDLYPALMVQDMH